MKGFFTPTEAGSVGTFAVILLAVAQRGLSLKGFLKSMTEALRTAGGRASPPAGWVTFLLGLDTAGWVTLTGGAGSW